MQKGKQSQKGKWETSISKALKNVYVDMTLESSAKKTLNDMLTYLSEKICLSAVLLTKYSNKITITTAELVNTIRLIFPKSLAEHTIADCTKAIIKYSEIPKVNILQFSISHAESDLRSVDQKLHVGGFSPVCLAAVLEYITAEIIELAGKVAKESRKVQITNRHIFLSIANDEELLKVFGNIIIKEGGVKPYINPFHLHEEDTIEGGAKKKKKKKKKSIDNIQGITKNALQRIGYRAGVKSMSGLIYEELRGVLTNFLEDKLKNAMIILSSKKRLTLNEDDLKTSNKAIALLNYHGVSQVVGGAPKPKSKSGTVALKNIKQEQEKLDLIFPKAPFQRLVREIGEDYKSNIRYTESFMNTLQIMAEDHLLKLLIHADLVAVHAGRQTVVPKDIQLVRRIRG